MTLAVYQVTGLFPENEPIQRQIREKANDILADFISVNPQIVDKKGLSKQIDVLLSYFSVAEQQNWVNSRNFQILSQEYEKIKDFSLKIPRKQPKTAEKTEISEPIKDKSPVRESSNPSHRQKTIIEMIKNKREVSLSELKQVFSQITPRTLRRDLSSLTNKNMIERIREGKENVLFVLHQEFDKGQIADRRL